MVSYPMKSNDIIVESCLHIPFQQKFVKILMGYVEIDVKVTDLIGIYNEFSL